MKQRNGRIRRAGTKRVMRHLTEAARSETKAIDPILEKLRQCPEAFKVGEILSEAMKERPNSGVLAWLSQSNEDEVFVSVVTITEIPYGMERLATGKRREPLDNWLRRDLILRFGGRILPVDLQIADTCGGLMSRSESMGRPMEARCFHRCYRGSSCTHSRHAEHVRFRAHR